MSTTCDKLKSRLAGLFQQRGGSEYGGESVTQGEHALQAALLAEQSGASPGLILAALLHDVGHLLHDLDEDAPDKGVDDVHEDLGARFLSERLPASVADPVRMHVDAKRYLCAVDPDYFGQLSPPSVTSLRLQGGPMGAEEIERFESEPYYEDAVRLRKWDDMAKVSGLDTPDYTHFLAYIDQVLEG